MAEERQEFCGEVTLWTRHDRFWIHPCMLLMVISACCYCSDLVFPFEMFLLGPGSCWWKELVLKLLSGIWEWQIGCKFYFISCCQVIDVRLKCDHDSVIWLFFQSSLFISQNFVLISMQIGARVSLDPRTILLLNRFGSAKTLDPIYMFYAWFIVHLLEIFNPISLARSIYPMREVFGEKNIE